MKLKSNPLIDKIVLTENITIFDYNDGTKQRKLEYVGNMTSIEIESARDTIETVVHAPTIVSNYSAELIARYLEKNFKYYTKEEGGDWIVEEEEIDLSFSNIKVIFETLYFSLINLKEDNKKK